MLSRSVIFAAAWVVLFQLGCAPGEGPTAEEENNLAVMGRIYEEFINQGNVEVFDELVAQDVVEHEEFPGIEPNHEGVKQFFAMFRSAFPDLHFEVEEMFAAGDKVVARIVMHGTHEGEFMGMPPTGNKISVEAIDIFRLVDGKVAEHWGIGDSMTMMQQLGYSEGR